MEICLFLELEIGGGFGGDGIILQLFIIGKDTITYAVKWACGYGWLLFRWPRVVVQGSLGRKWWLWLGVDFCFF